MIIKPVEEKDLDNISFFESHQWTGHDKYNLIQLKQMYEDYNYVIIGAYNDNQIIGYIIFSISDTIEILKIFVKEEFRKKGIGKQLIDYVANNNVQDIFLEVSSSNINAINFYLKLNFKQINIRKKYYDDGSDAIILVRKS